MSAPTLAERVVVLDGALAAVPHAFGGAIALAYYAEPRATIDLDLNVFVPAERFEEVAMPLRTLGVSIDDATAALVARDGQARVWWDDTPVDLFFAYDAFHDAAAKARRTVPFRPKLTTIARVIAATSTASCAPVPPASVNTPAAADIEASDATIPIGRSPSRFLIMP